MSPVAWRLAASLDVLRDEINATWPDRSKVSDGTIGDSSHLASVSDHNPNAAGVVRAFDITHDPSGGPDGADLAEQLRRIGKAGHPAPWYVVWDRRIASRTYGWAWRTYTGADPHTNHVHVSVVQNRAGYDSPRPWGIEGADMPISDADADKIAKRVLSSLVQNNVTPPASKMSTFITNDHSYIVEIRQIVRELASRSGLSAEEIQAVVKAGVDDALNDITINVDAKP